MTNASVLRIVIRKAYEIHELVATEEHAGDYLARDLQRGFGFPEVKAKAIASEVLRSAPRKAGESKVMENMSQGLIIFAKCMDFIK